MKHKTIDKKYLILCLDRLTRFKHTNEKYERVFKDILHKCGLNSDNLEIAKEIFNNSLENFDKKNNEFLCNLLEQEEKNMFYQNRESERNFPINLNIYGAIKNVEENSDLPLNIKRLLMQEKNMDKNPIELRKKYSLLYPLEKIILTEGATEEILLSEFAKKMDLDFEKEGILVLGAGGKNQVARKYYKMIEEVKLPIFILLDEDATETKKIIEPKLRKKDKIYLIKSGEFEDIIPRKIIIGAINNLHKNDFQISEKDFNEELNTVKNLKEIYRINGFGDFQKADFAKEVKKFLCKNIEIKGELNDIIEYIKTI
ncbi:MAG: hypothetical protein E7Z91_03590 [Cyanobacteria bacterium SIG30]|nr:hypothetical protein [Cyanobacteria bacterium SIG30]